ncbi:MAG: tautomerase family protein [Sphingopyxis sp.]
MPIISVTVAHGRSIEKKRGLIRALTDAAVASFDVRPEQVRVMLNELPLDHYGVAGTTFGEMAEGGTPAPDQSPEEGTSS